MSRPLRIEYKDAWYHVMNRGRHGDQVFTEESDFNGFITLLKESSELWKVNVCAFCLMPNHYHLLLQTPKANLSRFMRHVNGLYTQRFNRHHQVDGQLFRGRYKSILIGEADYIVELFRYISFNPVKAGLAPKPEDYKWSSYRSYLSQSRGDDWVEKQLILNLLGANNKTGKKKLDKISIDASADIYEFFSRKQVPSFIGSKAFVEQVRNGLLRQIVHPEIPESKKLTLEAEVIIKGVCDHFKIKKEVLFAHKRGKANIPRDIALFLVRINTGKTLSEIGEVFQIEHYSSVSTCIERVKVNRQQDKKLDKIIKKIESSLK